MALSYNLVSEGEVTRTWEAEFEGRTLVVQEDVLALSRMNWSWGIVGRDGFLHADGRAVSRDDAERRVLARATWG